LEYVLKFIFSSYIEVQGAKLLIDDASRVKFTKHAVEKFKLLKHYGFELQKERVIEAVLNPERLDEKEGQFLATRTIGSRHATSGL
jgi:hypothetical protein